MTLEQALQYCKFSKRYKGYKELLDCVNIALEEEDRLLYVSGIYCEVAKTHHISPSGVERNIRTLVDHAWKNGAKDSLESLSGGKMYDKPTVSEVIEILVRHMENA